MGFATLRAPKVNVWTEGAMQTFFCCVVGLFILLMAQAVWAVFSLVALYVLSVTRSLAWLSPPVRRPRPCNP
jgi:hypothetical protein